MLSLTVGPPPPTPPPTPTTYFLVAAFTPVPDNVLTAVAYQQTATAVATTIGTYTPMPSFATPTPFPKNLATVQVNALLSGDLAVVVETPTPANAAAATADTAVATAIALTTGTFTPVPTAYVTPFVVLPSPPAENAATEVARLTPHVDNDNPPPLPYNAVVGEYVIATATPLNVATAAALVVQVTTDAALNRPATATPWNWVVITPTPLPIPTATPTLPALISILDLTATPTPAATEIIPSELPDNFRNLILLKTDRSGAEEIFALNPVTNEVGKITRS